MRKLHDIVIEQKLFDKFAKRKIKLEIRDTYPSMQVGDFVYLYKSENRSIYDGRLFGIITYVTDCHLKKGYFTFSFEIIDHSLKFL